MVLVLDASGSMWGRINGKAKIVIAKEVMALRPVILTPVNWLENWP